MLIKLGEAVAIKPEDLQPVEKIAKDESLDIENRMAKFARELKVIAPQAKDFLYFTAVMMHAAEAACINEDGSPKKLSNGEVVTASWEPVGDGIKWVSNDPNLMPYKNNNCLVPGTDILMADGSRKAVEDVVVGDEVITHLGRVRKVSEVFKHDNNSEIYNLKVKHHPSLQITAGHPLYALSGPGIRKKSIKDLIKLGLSPEWVKAGDVEAGDILLSLRNIEGTPDEDLTPGQARLLGYFAAEGSFSKKYGKRQSVVFTFGSHEQDIVNLVQELVDQEFPECSLKIKKYESRSVFTVTLTGHGISEWFYDHIGENSHEKKLSNSIVFGANEVKRQFLLGWLEGDGCITEGNKIVGISTSPHLAWQNWLMLKSLGISVGIRKVSTCKRFIQINKSYKEYPCRDHYRLEVYGSNADKLCGSDSVKYKLEDIKHKNIDYNLDDNYTVQRLKEVEIESYTGPVYNFEVQDDHSYIANGIVVHNSDIFPEPELKLAYKKWVGRPLCLDHQSQSVDKIRGVIVDTVYDERRKRVIALCALDAKNYSDLADKVKTGVANNVSMGTAVGRAVCTEKGCHRVARTERDFCNHMRAKSCYGEINMDLSPIELSLVVQGADPKAKVKHIIASDVAKAAGLLTNYLQLKEASREVSTHDLESIKKDLEKLTSRIETVARASGDKSDDESDAVGPTHSKWSMDSDVDHNPVTQLNAPEAFPTYASELQQAILGAQTKLASLQENLLRLETKNEEPTMTKKNAYFQGTEEPTPGQKQYPVDPMNEKGRLMDKNLHGPAPFPGVGDIEGLYPGDEQTKKELLRLADEHERAMFRESALKKAKEQLLAKGYFQGTTDPKPGQTTYTPDPLNEKAREQDKTLVGPAPFPGVGNIEGLYGDDMKTKEMLSRASLKARFEKAAQPDGRIDKAASRWVVLANERPILAATVNQITKGNSNSLYDAVATESFGKSLLSRIQSEGFQATASALLKSAQGAPPPPPPPAPGADAGAPLPPPEGDVGAPDDLEPPEEVGDEAGDPTVIVDDLEDLMGELRDKLDQLKDKISGPVAEDAEGLEGVAPAGDEEFAPPPPPAEDGAPAPKTASQLQGMRKRVNAMLQEGIDETITALAKHVRELKSATRVYKEAYASMNSSQRDQLNTLTISAVKDARAMLADTNKLMSAVVKYAYGTAELEKRAAAEAKFRKAAQQGSVTYPDGTMVPIEGGTITADTGKADDEFDIRKLLDEVEEEVKDEMVHPEDLVVDEDEGGEAKEEKDDLDVPLKALKQEGGDTVVDTDKLASKAVRAQARVKLAQQGLLGFNEFSAQAHPSGSADAASAGNLDVKPVAPGAAFHVAKDIKDAMLELANMPPHVRKQAEKIQQLVSESRMKAEDVDKLVKHNVDADAVKYWKAMWGEAKDPESSEFASKLTQEHAQAKQAEQAEAEKGCIKRAYQMANEMFFKGLISEAQIDAQASDIMNYNDHGFESLKRIIAKQPAIKQASVPNVGLLSSGEVILPAVQIPTQAGGADIKGFFDNYFDQKGLKF